MQVFSGLQNIPCGKCASTNTKQDDREGEDGRESSQIPSSINQWQSTELFMLINNCPNPFTYILQFGTRQRRSPFCHLLALGFSTISWGSCFPGVCGEYSLHTIAGCQFGQGKHNKFVWQLEDPEVTLYFVHHRVEIMCSKRHQNLSSQHSDFPEDLRKKRKITITTRERAE